MISEWGRRIPAVLSGLLVAIFIFTVIFLIANALQNSQLQSIGKDLNAGVAKWTELFDDQQARQSDVIVRQSDLSTAATDEQKRDAAARLTIAQRQLIVASEKFNSHRDSFSSVLCTSITVLRSSWWPATIFVKQDETTMCRTKPASQLGITPVENADSSNTGNTEVSRPSPILPPPIAIYEIQKHIELSNNLETTYVLPIIFGMLGALIYSLREMLQKPARIHDIGTVSGDYLRVGLGGICGMLIGYVNPATASGVSVSPLLFSLVAGFSIDTVLSILEKISAALRYDNETPPARNGESAHRTKGDGPHGFVIQ